MSPPPGLTVSDGIGQVMSSDQFPGGELRKTTTSFSNLVERTSQNVFSDNTKDQRNKQIERRESNSGLSGKNLLKTLHQTDGITITHHRVCSSGGTGEAVQDGGRISMAPPSTRNLSRQRSTCFLLEPQRVQGSDFVEMLRLIGYPNAKNLKGEDFDWLCEGSEEVQLFLGWLCEVVDQRNAVSDEQLDAYNALMDSGQPILDTEELQSICKSGEKLEVELEMEDTRSLQELEEELQTLKALKTHRLHFRNKMESLGMTLHHKTLSLEQAEKEHEKNMNRAKDGITTLNARCNSNLQGLRNQVLELGEYFTSLRTDNILLSSLNLEGFMKLEDTCWKQIEQNATGLLPIKVEDLESQKEAKRDMEKENERLRTSWASQRIQQSVSFGFLNGNLACLHWLQGKSGDQVWNHELLPFLEREVKSLEKQIENIQAETLTNLMFDVSLGVCMPILKAWTRYEQSILTQVSESQAVAAEAILRKLTRLQSVELGLQLERRYHDQTEQELKDLKMELVEQSSLLGKRMLGQRDLRVSPQWLTPLRVDSRDHTGVRLCTMLEKPSKHKELFPKYEAVQSQGEALVQELKSMSAIFCDPLPQTSCLESDTEELHLVMCRGTQNLQLRDVELALASEALLARVSQFNHWFLDFFRDLERKKMAIQTSYMAQGRQLYVHFYQDPTLLARIVEDLEQRVKDLNLNQS
ncbi:HAUS augmin-like complex subunit 3 [Leptodactylus fuscus]|uniref:HAUS augmin-like complex subunit 3 n=1 Tax=Leptodactylus fuscus TaxID=238119 RepID=UPI003F4E64E2